VSSRSYWCMSRKHRRCTCSKFHVCQAKHGVCAISGHLLFGELEGVFLHVGAYVFQQVCLTRLVLEDGDTIYQAPMTSDIIPPLMFRSRKGTRAAHSCARSLTPKSSLPVLQISILHFEISYGRVFNCISRMWPQMFHTLAPSPSPLFSPSP